MKKGWLNMKKAICVVFTFLLLLSFAGCGSGNLTFTYEGKGYSFETTKQEILYPDNRYMKNLKCEEDGRNIMLYETYTMLLPSDPNEKDNYLVFIFGVDADGNINSITACDRMVECPHGFRVGDDITKIENVFGPDKVYDNKSVIYTKRVYLNANGKAVIRGEHTYSLTFFYNSRSGIIEMISLDN